MEPRKIDSEELKKQRFAAEDSLITFEERFEREHKLKSAMAQTNVDHEELSLIIKLSSGELVEVSSDLIDLEDDYVEIHGGIGIPLKAIVDVKI